MKILVQSDKIYSQVLMKGGSPRSNHWNEWNIWKPTSIPTYYTIIYRIGEET